MVNLLLVARATLVVVFACAVVGKVRSRAAYRLFVESTGHLAGRVRPAARPLAAAVVGGETAVVLLLVTPFAAGAGFALAGALLGGFAVAVGSAARRGSRAPCRCFGSSTTVVRGWHAAVDAVLAVLAVTAAVVTAMTGSEPAADGVAVVSAVVGIVVGLLIVRLDDLVGLFAAVSPARSVPIGPRRRSR